MTMNDDEFFEYMDAAHAESLHDPEADPDIDYSELALNVHSDLLEAWHAELSTRGNVTDFEIEQLQATKLAIMAYRILQSGRYLETALEVAKCCKVEELSNDQRQRLVNNLTE